MTKHELRTLQIIWLTPGLSPSMVSFCVWPDRDFVSVQGAGRAISRTLKRLEDQGLVARDKNNRVFLTSKGSSAVHNSQADCPLFNSSAER